MSARATHHGRIRCDSRRPAWLLLVATIIRSTVRLTDANCIGRAGQFDGDGGIDDERTKAALQLCTTCPALPECKTWLTSLPPKARPRGIVAATYLSPHAG
jgi:hypothetical protein